MLFRVWRLRQSKNDCFLLGRPMDLRINHWSVVKDHIFKDMAIRNEPPLGLGI